LFTEPGFQDQGGRQGVDREVMSALHTFATGPFHQLSAGLDGGQALVDQMHRQPEASRELAGEAMDTG
jgi:hypothetical protein